MIFDFFNAIISLDAGWFVWMLQNNLVYLFAFIALCFFFWEKNLKKTIAATILLSIVAWAWVTFEMVSGWVLFVGGFLAVYYITKLAILIFAQDVPQLKNKLIIISEIQFLVLVVAYNLFMR